MNFGASIQERPINDMRGLSFPSLFTGLDCVFLQNYIPFSNDVVKTVVMFGVPEYWYVCIRVQAENKKNSPGTFRNQFDPRIDLAPFFLPPGTVFAYHPGHLCGSLWPPLALPPLWTGLPHESD